MTICCNATFMHRDLDVNPAQVSRAHLANLELDICYICLRRAIVYVACQARDAEDFEGYSCNMGEGKP